MKVKLTADQANETYWALSARIEMWQGKRASAQSAYDYDVADNQIEECAAAMWAIDDARKGRK